MAFVLNQFDAGELQISDATSGTALSVTVAFDQGDFSVDGLTNDLTNVEAYQSRRTLHSLRRTDLAFPTVSFSAMVSEFSNDSAGTLLDLLHGTGEFASPAPVSTTAAKGDVMTFDVEFTVSDPGDGADRTFTLHDVHFTTSFSEGSPDTLSFSGTVYGEISGDIAIAQGGA